MKSLLQKVRGRLVIGAAAIALTAGMGYAQTANVSTPEQPLAASLRQIAQQTGENILFTPGSVAGIQAHAISGQMTAQRAVEMLLVGTNLEVASDGNGGLVVRPKNVQAASNEAAASHTGSPEIVIVTGSRLPQVGEGAQDVKVFDRGKIEQSGQTTVEDFLSTLPDVSKAFNESGQQSTGGITGIQLHGLPIGTTLVLLNGRRVENSGAAGDNGLDILDLNTIPLAAVERIEVLSEGASAVYGSDAIAGVVNIIFRKDFDGINATARYGGADGMDETDLSFGWGRRWNKLSLSIVGTFQTRSELAGSERAITANQDYTRFGGSDSRASWCNPGNVFTLDGSNLPGLTSSFAAIGPTASGNPKVTGFSGTPGTLNLCSTGADSSLIPSTQREGVFAQASYELTPSIQVFAELLASHVRELSEASPPALFGFPQFDFALFTVPASNPFNPFGETVGISTSLTGLGRTASPLVTTFFRPLVGIRGTIWDDWEWEVSAWYSRDDSTARSTNFPDNVAIQDALNSPDISTALNPFVAGNAAPVQLLKSLVFNTKETFDGETIAGDGFVRGPVFDLPAGPLTVVVGAEYDRDKLGSNNINYPFAALGFSSHSRTNYAVFGEARIPIFKDDNISKIHEVIAATVAARYDNYGEFGSRVTPQYGIEVHPSDILLFRATYGQAFKAPSLFNLFTPTTSQLTLIADPKNGNAIESVTGIFGGNLDLRPETGISRTLGVVYTSDWIPGLRVAVTKWGIDEANSIQFFGWTAVVQNEDRFPGLVERAPPQNGHPGPITSVKATYVNFGSVSTAGVDYAIDFAFETGLGTFTPSIAATQAYRFREALVPNTRPVSVLGKAQDAGFWAPQWKGTATINWNQGPYSFHLDGRYVGSYQDYDSARHIGDFWLFDANFRFQPGQDWGDAVPWLNGAYVELGGVNIFNSLPQFSNAGFGTFGYDASQADIRGRFLYAQIGVKL